MSHIIFPGVTTRRLCIRTLVCSISVFEDPHYLLSSTVDIMPIIDSPEFGHAFVPIDSLTGSPRSSTGSTSVLEWNSNSGSEGFSVRSLDHVQSTPPTPDIIPTFSSNLSSPKTSLPDHDEIFASFNSAAPATDSVTTTVTSDTSVDEYHNLLSALQERLTLQDSVTQWQNYSYRETAGFDRADTPSDIELIDNAISDKPHNNLVSSPNRSLATDSSISAATAKPSVHVSSLFLPPAPPTPPTPPTPSTPHLYTISPSVMSNHSQSEGISIAQYFQLKAAKEAEPVQPPVDGPLRPISAASCLSYASSVQSPASVPLPDLHERWHDLMPKVEHSSCTMALSPPTPAPQCSSSYRSWYKPTYSPSYSPPAPLTPQSCFPITLRSSPPRKSQMGNNNNTGSQFNPFIGKVTPPSLQGADTPESNLKSHAPSKPGWPIPPATSCPLEPVTLKPIQPIIPNSPRNIHDRPSPSVTYNYGSLHGKVRGKPTNRPVPPRSQASRSPDPRIRDIGQVSPASTDSVLLPPPSTPSVSSPTRPASPRSARSASAVPPSPPLPYVPLTPIPASPLNGGYASTQRTPRALPIPSISRTFGSHTQTPYMPRSPCSTLPRDMHLSAAPPTPWGPTPRRLRFAPLPHTPSGLPYTSAPSYTQPYTAPSYAAPQYPLYSASYPYQSHAPAPQIPAPVPAPYPSWRPGPTINSSPLWTPHPVFWYSDGSIVFRVCQSFLFFFPPLKIILIPFGRSRTLDTKSIDTSSSVTQRISVTYWHIQRMP